MKGFLQRHTGLAIGLAAAAALGFLVWAVFILGRPLPPRTVLMTTGPEGGAYRELGEKYRAALAREGIDLKLVPSLGNVENLNRLRDPKSGVSVGFASGGLITEKDSSEIVSLGTISYDPIWIFCRDLPAAVSPKDLRGTRISIGPEGSGTRAVMLELLRANRVEDDFTPLPLSPGAGGEALLRGEIDCACMLTASDAPIVRKLLADERVSLVTFPRADAYAELYPYLRKLTLFRGVGSLEKDLPREDVTLLAPMSSLLVRADLHPAIQFLLLEAASEIHSRPGIFRRPGQFPAPEPVDVPLSSVARTYYKSGGTFLQRHLPFWLGVLAQRIVLVLIPLAGIVYPLVQLVPAAINYAVEHRLRLLYVELRRIEAHIAAGRSEAARDLTALEQRVSATKVPASGARSLYILKQHVALVKERLVSRESTPAGAAR
ncbi:MAG: TAXI family TRAP transporter solute-binding subunit [Thermoanaerobaculia bacterium]